MYSVGCPRREMELTPCPQARTGPLAADARIAGTGVPGNGRQRGRRLHWRFHCGGTGAFGTSVRSWGAPGERTDKSASRTVADSLRDASRWFLRTVRHAVKSWMPGPEQPQIPGP